MITLDLLIPVCALVAAVLSLFLVEKYRGGTRWVGVSTLFAASMLGGYLFPLVPYLEGTDYHSISYPTAVDVERSVGSALWLAAMGAAAFALGWTVISRRKQRPVGVFVPTVLRRHHFRALSILLTLFGLGLFALGVVAAGGVNAVLEGLNDRVRAFEGLNYLFQSIYLLLAVALVWFARLLGDPQPLWQQRMFWLYLLVTFVLMGSLGNKSTIFVAVVAFVVMYDEGRKRIGVLVAAISGCSLILAIIAYGLIARQYLVSGAIVTITDWDVESIWKLIELEMGGHLIQLQMLTLLVDRMPGTLDWQYGLTLLSLLTMPIPRAIWPDKLLPATGPVTEAFYPGLRELWGTTIPPGMIGEFFMNFGLIGVPVGMFLAGAGYAILRKRWLRRRNTSSLIAYAFMLALLPHYVRGELVSPTILFLVIFIPASFLLRVAKVESHGGRSAPRPAKPLGEQSEGR